MARPKKLTWKQLNACTDADAIAALLRQHGIVGKRHLVDESPLAKATGWNIEAESRWRFSSPFKIIRKPLTRAQAEFGYLFDTQDQYVELREEEQW